MRRFGLTERGRPPLLTFPRASISSVSSGSSSYSSGWITWVATRARSEPEEWRDTRFLAVIGFPHAEDVAIRATRRVTNNNHPVMEHAEANNPSLTLVHAYILGLEVRSIENTLGILEIQASGRKRLFALLRIVCDCHMVTVSTETILCKRPAMLLDAGCLTKVARIRGQIRGATGSFQAPDISHAGETPFCACYPGRCSHGSGELATGWAHA